MTGIPHDDTYLQKKEKIPVNSHYKILFLKREWNIFQNTIFEQSVNYKSLPQHDMIIFKVFIYKY